MSSRCLCDFDISVNSSFTDNSVNVNVTNSNNIDFSITFSEARQRIDDIAGLSDADAEEIKDKITQLEDISKESIPKKKKMGESEAYSLFCS